MADKTKTPKHEHMNNASYTWLQATFMLAALSTSDRSDLN